MDHHRPMVLPASWRANLLLGGAHGTCSGLFSVMSLAPYKFCILVSYNYSSPDSGAYIYGSLTVCLMHDTNLYLTLIHTL